MSELSKVMIYRKSARVLEAACWSCRASDTYCDGLQDSPGYQTFCCDACATEPHDTHTGEDLRLDGHDDEDAHLEAFRRGIGSRTP